MFRFDKLTQKAQDAMQHCQAVAERSDSQIIYPLHLNPNVRRPVQRILGGSERIHLVEPVDYLSFVHLMTRSDFILTDSGGVQEEASTLGKPVLILRDTTERSEGVRGGNMRLVGTERHAIAAEAKLLLRDPAHRTRMSSPSGAFGDGKASARIARVLSDAAFPPAT